MSELYCFVENGVISPPQPLPRNWHNISNFNALDSAVVGLMGWFPYQPVLQPAYNPTTQRVESQLHFDGVTVNQSWTVVALTQAEQVAYLRSIRPVFEGYLEEHMRHQVSFKDYKTVDSACSWLASSIASWAQDSQQAIAFRDACYGVAYQIENDIVASLRSVPTREQFIAALPLLGWEPPPPPNNGNGTSNGTL